MRFFLDLLIIIHLLSLAAGFISTFGNVALMPVLAGAKPDEAMVLRRIQPRFLQISSFGLAGLWITGILLLWLEYGFRPPWLFWVKFLAVLGLTGAVGYIQMLSKKMRETGDVAIGAQLAQVGPIAGLCALVAVIFAVLTFH